MMPTTNQTHSPGVLREPLRCCVCGVELTGSLDTYGAPGEEICQADWIRDSAVLTIKITPRGQTVMTWDDEDDELDDWGDEDDDLYGDDDEDWDDDGIPF